MLTALVITFREVVEATLIVATLLGLLKHLKLEKAIKVIWSATFFALVASVGLLTVFSFIGVKFQEIYTGETEELIEGILMIISAGFVTWAVFFLHTTFARYKTALLAKIRPAIEKGTYRNIFVLTFTAVFREGLEIVLFLSTIYLSSSPLEILQGFMAGSLIALALAFLLFTASFRLPLYYAFRFSSFLLVLFAAGLLAQGVHELMEIGVVPETKAFYVPLIPAKDTITGGIIQSLLGITQKMRALEVAMYLGYSSLMYWYLHKPKTPEKSQD